MVPHSSSTGQKRLVQEVQPLRWDDPQQYEVLWVYDLAHAPGGGQMAEYFGSL